MLLVIVKDKAYVRDVVMVDETVDEVTDELRTRLRNQLLSERKMRPSEFIEVIPINIRKKRGDV